MAHSDTDLAARLAWDDLRVFLAAARAGSFSAAARALGTDQSTVSRRVAALEETLDQRLFERGPRSLACTTFGAQLLEPAAAVEREVLSLVDEAVGTERTVRGRVRIALTEGMAQHAVIPQVLPGLLAAHPELSISLSTSESAVDLSRHEADIALRFFRTERGPLVGQRVARMPLCVLVAKPRKKELRSLPVAELPWVRYRHPVFESGESAWLDAIGAKGARLDCSSVESQIAAVRAGLGVAFASRALPRVYPDLVPLDHPEVPAVPPLELHVVTRAAIRRVPRIKVVYEALVTSLAQLETL